MLIATTEKYAVPVGIVLHKVAREKVTFSDFLIPTDQIDGQTAERIHSIVRQERPNINSLRFLGQHYFGLTIQQGLVIEDFLRHSGTSVQEILNQATSSL